MSMLPVNDDAAEGYVEQRPQRARQLWRCMYHPEHGWPHSMAETAGSQNGLGQNFR